LDPAQAALSGFSLSCAIPSPISAFGFAQIRNRAQYANHGSEHITAFPLLVVLLGRGWRAFAAKQQKIGAAHGRPGLRFA
jgi:hypothetical protein